MQKALVTGGAGFIGSHLVRELVKQGVKVRILDNVSSGNLGNLDGLGTKMEFVEGDIRNAIACRNACRGVDAVFHMAALVSVPQSVADPIMSDAINSGGTLNMLIAARDCGVKRFVFSSSSAVYGETETIPTSEICPTLPMSPYGIQKLMGEHYARNFTLLYGLETICLRYFNVYGPGQNPNSAYAAVIPKFLTRHFAEQTSLIFGDGEQTRDFCHVRDIVQANILAAKTSNSSAIGGVFNVGNGSRITVNDLLILLKDALGESLKAEHQAERAGDIRHSGADIAKSQTVLDYAAKVSLPSGLKETADFYRNQFLSK